MAEGASGGGGRVPPYDLAAERAVLGGLLLENAAYDLVAELPLRAEDFYRDAHARIYEVMQGLFMERQPVDTITVRERLVTQNKLAAVGGEEYLLGLTDTIPTKENVHAYAQIVQEKAIVRRMILACHEIAARGYGDYGLVADYVNDAERNVFDVSKEHARSPYEHVNKVVLRTFEEISAATDRDGDHVTGLPTGFASLDWYTAGFHPGDLIICAGRPGMGKTSFALNLAVNAVRARNIPAIFFSLEMSKEQLARRLLCSEARVDSNKLRSGRLSREDWAPLARAADEVSRLPVWLDDTPGLTVMELRAKARRLQSEAKLGLIVVDYIQLMRSGARADNREQEISEISRSLKAVAKELKVPVIALSQLNRAVENRATKDKRPLLSDLRESGALEQDADTILFIYREEEYNKETEDRGVAEIIIGKQRSGPTGIVKCKFLREYTRFENLDDRHGDQGAPFDAA